MELSGIGAFGIVPFLSEDIMKQAKFANIKTRAGKIAYFLALGKQARRPVIHEGIEQARGALKWIKEFLEEEEK
ncbi:hypothetical protein COT42_03380 [Candidatus Saganbacteria bacterium CG08_land_8_20_14_0_20_45_16]|uniref:Uncharacterized protein n=1 Tax=Candidatus Saganbacteria bacterium CG08_land_8_20_14_0_20_45_16 TaxID=2014293 RepID=A0A2H0XYV5_UNCSA|nr:MAG: hypothetical protein COT42_03380 [Candidatus Saganbacteria bacterium CG08_land_8_20_14_0_20_45_16]